MTGYSESVRQTLTLAAAASGSASNTASKAAFSINATVTAGGAFVTSDSTKSGTSGNLFSVSAFTGDNRDAVDGDTINVTATFTVADA